eukprot:GHVS01085789.1.p1 GENE.GHVS01085789.1~~GHVS01085789.1.p1  ORF type:complete len:435 (-),score=72.98 GHVS01085789.1:680-1984(-)
MGKLSKKKAWRAIDASSETRALEEARLKKKTLERLQIGEERAKQQVSRLREHIETNLNKLNEATPTDVVQTDGRGVDRRRADDGGRSSDELLSPEQSRERCLAAVDLASTTNIKCTTGKGHESSDSRQASDSSKTAVGGKGHGRADDGEKSTGGSTVANFSGSVLFTVDEQGVSGKGPKGVSEMLSDDMIRNTALSAAAKRALMRMERERELQEAAAKRIAQGPAAQHDEGKTFMKKRKGERDLAVLLKQIESSKRAKAEQQKKRKLEEQPFDLWEAPLCIDGSVRVPSCRQEWIPAVKLPHAGQSYHPSTDDYKECLKWAVRSDVKQLESDRRVQDRWNPLTTALLEYFPSPVVQPMSFLTKQRIYHQLCVAPSSFKSGRDRGGGAGWRRPGRRRALQVKGYKTKISSAEEATCSACAPRRDEKKEKGGQPVA